MGRFAFALAVFVVGCGSSKGDDGATSANDITRADAGADAAPTGCVPCADRYSEGKKVYDAARRACFCDDAVCYESCAASLCAHTALDADPACGACMDTNLSGCVQDVQAKCEASADCSQYIVCESDSASACH